MPDDRMDYEPGEDPYGTSDPDLGESDDTGGVWDPSWNPESDPLGTWWCGYYARTYSDAELAEGLTYEQLRGCERVIGDAVQDLKAIPGNPAGDPAKDWLRQLATAAGVVLGVAVVGKIAKWW